LYKIYNLIDGEDEERRERTVLLADLTGPISLSLKAEKESLEGDRDKEERAGEGSDTISSISGEQSISPYKGASDEENPLPRYNENIAP